MIVENDGILDNVNFIYVIDKKCKKFKIYLNDDGTLCVKSFSDIIGVYIATKNCIKLTTEYNGYTREI